ncbi:MAG: ATP phosphoribosyltransferase [Rhizomicrobium sp.]
MGAHPDRLTIALQKNGRLAEASLALMREAGLSTVKSASDLLYRVENYPIDILRVRDDDIPTLVGDSVADLGVVGRNVLAEQPHRAGQVAQPVMALGFGHCALKIAVPENQAYGGASSLSGKRVATSHPHVLARFLAEHKVDAEIVAMQGAVEVAPRLKLAHAICDLVSTGATLEANGLRAVETVLESEAMLVRSPKPPAGGLGHVAHSVEQRFRGVIASRGAKYVMMNAPTSALDAIARVLPGAGAPTVTPLAGRDDMVAVHAVCQESVFWETLERLRAVGASAILVLPIEKMM